MKIARAVDGVSKKGAPCGINCTLYASEKGTPVMTVIHQGGHDYPDGTSEMIVKFFQSQALSKAGTELRFPAVLLLFKHRAGLTGM